MRKASRRGVRKLVLGMAVASVPIVAQAADTWSISLGVREISTNPAVGSDGGTTGSSIEWVNLDGNTINADGLWHQYTWNFGSDPVTSFSGGNGALSSAFNKGVLEHIRILNSGGNNGGAINLRIDDIVNTVSGTPTNVATFETSEGFTTALTSSQPMFREPIFSGTTLANMGTGLNSTLVSTTAHSGAQSVAARWSFVPDGSTSRWLRLSTNSATVKPNPTIDFTTGNTLSLWLRASVTNPSGTRALGVDVSSNQGTGIDWNKVAQPASTGGGGLTFAFARATRGGTSGTSTTGAMRVDDSTYAYNIAGAKAAGMLTGPYHFGRPDMWTANDSVGLGDAPGSVGTPEDEARHMLEIAGKVMKPGYMRPVYDLEDGGAEQNVAQMSNFVHRFANTLMKYKGPSAKIIVYAGQSYATSEVNSTVATYPLWMPRWPSDPDPWASDPFSTESSYGVWDPPGTGNPMPWSFWQYNSPEVYIPGIGGASGITHNDIDVAHGDVNYVKTFMVQGAIWDGSADATWTNASNWDTGVAPVGSTEVLFDLGIPGTGATITLTSGRSAGGVYFADSYTLSGGSLTLTDGRIDVDSTKTGTIATSLSAPNGFRKVGLGTMTHSSGTSTVTGIAQVLQGTMNVSGGSVAVSGNLLVNPELTQFDKSLVAPLPTSASQITSGTLTINGGTMTAAAAYVGGTETAAGAIGTLNVSSGSLSVTGLLKIWNSTLPFVNSKVNFSGGALSIGSLDTNGDPASFSWTGGTLTIGGDNSTSTFRSSGSGSAALVKAGGGTLTLGAAQNYSGTTAVTGGTFRLGLSNALLDTSAVTISPGATFSLNGFSDTIASLAGAGTVSLAAGTLTTGGSNASTTYSGAITGSGALVKNGSGTMTLSGASTYSGGTTLNAGTLSVAADNNLGSAAGPLSIAGGTFSVTGSFSTARNWTLSASTAVAISVASGQTLTMNGVIGGGGGLTHDIQGSGTLVLANNNTYSGTLRLFPTLQLGIDNALPTGSSLVSGGPGFGIFDMAGFDQTLVKCDVPTILNNTGSLSILTIAGPAAYTHNGLINGNIAVVYGPSATVTVAGTNNYTSGTTIHGTVSVSANANLGSNAGALTFGAGGGGTLNPTANFSMSRNIVLSGNGTFNHDASAYVTASGVISGPGGLVKSGLGWLTLSGANTYTGGTTLNLGQLSVSADNNLGNAAGPVVSNNTLAALDVLASFSTLRDITLNFTGGTIQASPNTTTLTVNGNVSGTGGLVKVGTGTLLLAGANTWTGATTVTGNGKLALASNLTTSSSVSADGATLELTSGGGNNRVIKTPLVSVTGGGKLDLRDNKLITAADIGSWNGSAYTGITGYIQSGRNEGTWDGSGIMTSMTDATSSVLTTLAVASADETGYAGGTFGGVSVTSGDTLVMYTWGGDADLNGELNGDDYFRIDSNALAQIPGYFNGDFNYDGVITGDDYFIIDSNIVYAQNSPPFPTGSGASLAPIPEPGGAGVILGLALGACSRRRRGRLSDHAACDERA